MPPDVSAGCVPTPSHVLSETFAPGYGDGPAYPVGGTEGVHAFVSGLPPGEPTEHKVLWVADAGFDGLALVRGMALDGHGPVRFRHAGQALDDELRIDWSRVQVSGRSGWRELPSHTVVSSPGCYAWQIDTHAGTDVIVFRSAVIPQD